MEVNERIKKRRLELQLSLKDVAKALGVAESTVSRYESKDIQNMGIDKIEALSKVLQCTPAYLMGWEDNKEKYTNKKDFPAIPEKFTNAIDARAYVTSHQIFGFGGFEPNKMSDEDILNFANEMIDQAELLGLKYTKNKER